MRQAHARGAFGGLERADAPIERALRQARQRTESAQRRLPKRAIAVPPTLADPSRAQTQAAKQLITKSIARQVAPGSGRERQQQRQEIARELWSDPRYHRSIEAMSRIARAEGSQPNVQMAVQRAHRDVVRAGRAPTQVQAAGVNVDLTALGRSVVKATSLNKGDAAANRFVKNALKDVGTLGAAPVLGGYEAGRAAYDVARHGDTRRARDLAKGVAKGVAASAPAQLATGHPGKAAEQFLEHPVLTGLDFAGAGAIAGRGAGAVARGLGSDASKGGVRGSLARGGSTVRPPLALSDDPGDRALVQRSYSKDSTRKAAQVAADAAREPLRREDGSVVTTKDRGRELPVLKAHPAERKLHENRRGDFTASRANAVERLDREEAAREGRRADRGVGKAGREIVSLAIEGTVRSGRSFRDDLVKERKRLTTALADPERFRDRQEVKRTRARLTAVQRTLSTPKAMAQAERIVAAAERHGRDLNAQDTRAARLGLEDPAAQKRARLIPAALSHVPGARHVTVEEHRRLERAAVKHERAALEKARQAPKGRKRDALLAEYRAAKQRRVEVSGRDPQGVHRHEQAKAAGQAARLRHQQAQAALARARTPEARTAAFAAERKARSERTRAEQAARDSKLPDIQAAVRHGDGRFLPNEEIEGAVRAAGRDPETVAYLPHRQDVRGARAHHSRFDVSRPGPAGQRRTGESYQRGSSGEGPALVEDARARKATQLAKAEQVDRFVSENGLTHPAVAKARAGKPLSKAERRVVARGGYFNTWEADELAKRLASDTGREYVAVRAMRAGLPADVRAFIRENEQNPLAMEGLGQRLLNDRIVEPGDASRARNVVLVPADRVNRLKGHLAPAGGIERFMQLLNKPFRFSVLPQPRWLAGNFIEPYLVRLPMVGSGLVNIPGLALDIAAATKTVKRMERSKDPKMRRAAREVRAQQFGGLFIGQRGASVRRTAGEAIPGPVGELATRAAATSAGKAVRNVVTLLPNLFFQANRELIERWAQEASFGKDVRRDIESFTGSWAKALRLSDAAVDDVAKGLVGTPAQERFMRSQHELLGKYEGFSPTARHLIQGPFPFVPWMLSAARFVYWTMPAHHTVKTDLLLKAQQATAEAWAQDHADGEVPPGGLRYAPRTKDGGFVDVARYTPYSAGIDFEQGDFASATDQFAPQVQGAYKALGGRDPFGRDLRVEPSADNPRGEASPGQRAGIAVYGLLEAMGGPYLSIGRRLREKGATPYSDSTAVKPKTKPGTSHMSAARRTFDPFRPTYLRSSSAPAVTAPAAPRSRADRILEQRARMLEGKAAKSSRFDAILERRARMLAGG